MTTLRPLRLNPVIEKHVTQEGVCYWAEKDAYSNSYVVLSYAVGGPITEAYDDRFRNWDDADEIAEKLANGEL